MSVAPTRTTSPAIARRRATARWFAAGLLGAWGTGGLTAGAAQPPAPHPNTLWLWAADPARDPVHAADTEAALVRRYGRANVRRDSLPGAEGEMAYGTVLFPRDPRRTLYVYWDDAHPFTRPASASPAPGATAWVVWPGVALGTPMAEVERLNGRAFRLFGFEWDYGGAVIDWRGGRLGALWRPKPDAVRVAVRFTARGPTTGVSGEGTFSSALPAMRAARARVADLTVGVR